MINSSIGREFLDPADYIARNLVAINDIINDIVDSHSWIQIARSGEYAEPIMGGTHKRSIKRMHRWG